MSAALEYHRTGKSPKYTAGFEIVVGPSNEEFENIMKIVGGYIDVSSVEFEDFIGGADTVDTNDAVNVIDTVNTGEEASSITDFIEAGDSAKNNSVDITAFIDTDVDYDSYIVDE